MLTAPFAVESVVLEIAATVTVTAWMAVDLIEESRHDEMAVQTAPDRAASSVGHPPASTSPPQPQQPRRGGRHQEPDRWERRARRAEDDAERLARALDFHVVNECDCLTAVDMALLRRHQTQMASAEPTVADPVCSEPDQTGDGSSGDHDSHPHGQTAEQQ